MSEPVIQNDPIAFSQHERSLIHRMSKIILDSIRFDQLSVSGESHENKIDF